MARPIKHKSSRKEKKPQKRALSRPRRRTSPIPTLALPAAAPARPGGVDEIVILPVRSMVLFPGMVMPISVGREKSLHALEEAVRTQRPVGLLLQRDPSVDDPSPTDLYSIGTLAEILRYVAAEDGTKQAICQGVQRFRVIEFTKTAPYLSARVERIEEPRQFDDELEARLAALRDQAREALSLWPGAPEGLEQVLQGVRSPTVLADMVATFMDLPDREKQELLETLDPKERMEKTAQRLAHALEVLKLSRDIQERTKGALDRAQREYYLREQLRTIQRELGEDDSSRREVERLSEAITAAKMPEAIEKDVRKELARLESMPQASAEYSMLRTWLEIATELPWSKSTEDSLDLARARAILDEDHHGLEKVKQRILEFLAVKKLKPDGKSPILCLVGPPGVGKTSLGQSVARAMSRKFARVSLGGVHDEAEIRGHRRTYVGAMPGRILQALRKGGSNNPVFMLDELDKLSAGIHGDPSAAMLEVLDPEQNRDFRDNYLDLPFDLSRVMFIGTANVIDQIPRPLRDRCEVIRIPGYIEEEKLAIARRYLVPRMLEQNGLTPEQCTIDDGALVEIVRGYTREAGVRNLEREIGALVRRAASKIAGGEATSVAFHAQNVREVLGPPKFENEVAMRTAVSGVATGLAWTPTGGEILFVEATRMNGKGGLILTGQLGDVMRESAQAALSLVKAHAHEIGIDPKVFETSDIHVHLPAGAIQKDGPSAGVALYVALASLLTARSVRSDIAMTGEISLRGLVLPVGGIREKVLAALAAGIRTVLLPARNVVDLEEVPAKAREQLKIVPLERVEEAVAAALEPLSPAASGAGHGSVLETERVAAAQQN